MLPLCALVLPVLLIACGLAIDVGLMESHSLTMQQAADASAVAAELELERGTGNWAQVAQQTAALNGFADGTGQVKVSVRLSPTTGEFAGYQDAVSVVIADEVDTIFMKVADEPSSVVSVRAVALAPPCLYLSGASGALAGTAANITLSCPMYANRSAVLDGNSSLQALAENFVGGAGETSSGRMVTAPRFGAKVMADPLAALPEPTAGACAYTSFQQSGGTVTLNPGTYCNGMTLRNTNVTLAPGLYVITGGAHWSGANVVGAGVTLYFTAGNGVPVGQFVVDSSSRLQLSAPLSGSALAGIVVFGSRSWTATQAQDFQLLNSSEQGNGIWYLPGSGLLLSGSTLSSTKFFGLDAATLVVNQSRLTGVGDYSSIATGSPFRPLGGLVQ